jgi:hypothetical protein
MPSPDLLDRIEEQSRIARRAIAEAQAVIADTIAALEQAIRAAAPDAEMRHIECADPPAVALIPARRGRKLEHDPKRGTDFRIRSCPN